MQLKKMSRGLAVLLSAVAIGATAVPAAFAQAPALTAAEADAAAALAVLIEAAVLALPATADTATIKAAIQAELLKSNATLVVGNSAVDLAEASIARKSLLSTTRNLAFNQANEDIQLAMNTPGTGSVGGPAGGNAVNTTNTGNSGAGGGGGGGQHPPV